MSLLLDALKRSEKARQEKAAQAGGDGPAETREFSLESLEEEARDAGHVPPPREERPRVAETVEQSAVQAPTMDEPEEPAPRRAATEDTVEGFPDLEIVEPDPVQTMHERIDVGAPPPRRGVEATGTGERPTFSLLDDDEAPADDAIADTSGTIPTERAVRGSTERYFDGTQSMSVSMREVRRAIESEDTNASGERAAAGHTSTTQRRARTVVEARAAGSNARGRSSAWIWLVLVLVFGGAVAFGGYYYYTEVIDAGPTLFAGGQPPVRTGPPPEPIIVEPEAPVQTASVAIPQEPLAPPPPPRGELAPSAEPEAAAEPAPAVEMPAAPPVEEVLKEPEPAPPVEPVAPEDVQRRLAKAIEDAGLRGQSPVGIRVSKVTRADTVSPQLARAYEAFQRGDDATATQTWSQVLAKSPDNRDALLGLAAAAVRGGQPQQAIEHYARILRLRPQDPVAQAAIIALSDRIDPVEAESRTKLLLEAEPEAPHLHFILGNAYAAQSRWALAQEAYFDAYRLDSSNPDYVFNLAVSLDHLAQPRAALDFYRRALQLADSRSVGFETASVMNRIRVMTADAATQ